MSESKYTEQGIRLIDDQLLVKPDPIDDTFKTSSGVTIYKAQTSESAKMEEAAQTKATIVALSDSAYIDLPDHYKPKIGERVYIERHAGSFFEGADKERYRIIREKDVVGFINF